EDRERDHEGTLRDRPQQVQHGVDRVDREPEEHHGRERETDREEERLDPPEPVHAQYAEQDDAGYPGQVYETDDLPEERHSSPVLLEDEREPEEELYAEDNGEERNNAPVVEAERVADSHRASSMTSRYAAMVRS